MKKKNNPLGDQILSGMFIFWIGLLSLKNAASGFRQK